MSAPAGKLRIIRDPYVSPDDVDLTPEVAAQMREDRKRDDLAAIVDITAKLRADIESRNWSAYHIRADKAQPVDLPTHRKWSWS